MTTNKYSYAGQIEWISVSVHVCYWIDLKQVFFFSQAFSLFVYSFDASISFCIDAAQITSQTHISAYALYLPSAGIVRLNISYSIYHFLRIWLNGRFLSMGYVTSVLKGLQ